MIIKNRYWYLHGGSSFYLFDSYIADLAQKEIGDCMTSNASVQFLQPILVEELESYEKKIQILHQTLSTITFFITLEREKSIFVSGTFTFVRIKK